MKLDSYPPVFRTQETVDPDKPNGSTIGLEPDPTPLLDFHGLDLDLLAGACKEWGLFRLFNQGVPPPALLTQLQDQARELFGLPFETKRDLFADPPLSYFWGTPALTPSGAALSRGPRNVNWVEGFNVPLGEIDRFCPDHPLLRRFRDLLEEYGSHMERLGRTIFEGMARSLGLDMEQTRLCLSEGTGILRIYRYPKCGIASESWGMDAHTDSSVLSIVSQDGVGGLEVVKDGEWHLVQPLADALVVNLGDMMQAMSDDKYKSAMHRVKVNKYEERLSICYFVFPAPACVVPSSKYRPFTYSDFQSQVQQDIKTLGIKVGLERFKIEIT